MTSNKTQSAKDGERQAALEEYVKLERAEARYGLSGRDLKRMWDLKEQLKIALTAKPDAGVDVEALKQSVYEKIMDGSIPTYSQYPGKTSDAIIDHLYSSGRLSSKAEWQNISTAPKDSQMIWAWDGKEGYLPLTWMPQFYGDKSEGYWACVYSDPFKPVENFTPKFFANLPKGALPQPPIAGGDE